jgi:ABC-type transport system involved in cytochrome c biogenesis permease subunit
VRHADAINLLLALAAVAHLAAALLLRARRTRAGYWLFGCGWLCAAVLLVFNSLLAEAPALGNMYQVQVLLALCFLPAHLLLRHRHRLDWTALHFATAAALPLVGALFLDKDTAWRQAPALQSAWFVPHVSSYIIGYAFATVAAVLTGIGEVRRLCDRPDAGHAEAARQVVRLAFPFLTFGLLSGALWADQAWASYWSWDPKETWSLITWLLYAAVLHCHMRPALQRLAAPLQFLAFGALLITFLVVNLAPRFAGSLHSYA